jgi:hypothetical protein
MSTDSADFEMTQKPKDPYAEPPRKPRGCLFYGCLIAGILALLTVLMIAAFIFLGIRAYFNVRDHYTSPTPMVLPKLEMSDEERKALRDRIDAFSDALEDGEDAEPLVLTGDELNAFLLEDSELKDRVHFVVEGDQLKGEMSVPLGDTGLPGLKGRYLNGEATFRASLQNGQLVINAESAEINGQRIPDKYMAEFRKANLVEDAMDKPITARILRSLQSIEIKDGKVIITPMPKEVRVRRKKAKEAPKKEEPAEEPAKSATPAAPERGEP